MKRVLGLLLALACGSAQALDSSIVPILLSQGASLTVSWVQPTKNADGTAIGAITEQTVYYDATPRMGTGTSYANSAAVGSGSLTSKRIRRLVHGRTYCFAVTVTTSLGESQPSAEICAVAP